jgi:hypothetical protein
MAELLVYSTDAGTFLEFRTSTGNSTTVHVDAFMEQLPRVARHALRDWCKEARDNPDIDHELVHTVFIEGWGTDDDSTDDVTDMPDHKSNRAELPESKDTSWSISRTSWISDDESRLLRGSPRPKRLHC